MEEFKKSFGLFYAKTKSGTGCKSRRECLYYGFAVHDENEVFCREGYKNAQGLLNHLDEVTEELKVATGLVGENGLQVSVIGPKLELEVLKDPLGPLGTTFFELDGGSIKTFQ